MSDIELRETKKEIEVKVEVRDRLEELIEQYLSALDAKEQTKRVYRSALYIFAEWIKEVRSKRQEVRGELRREDILEYKNYLQTREFLHEGKTVKKLSSLTVSSYLVALRGLFAYLEGQKIYPDIAKDIKGMKAPRGFLKNALSKVEVKMLLESISNHGDTETQRKEKELDIRDYRDYAMINLMVRTGLRTIEVVRALIKDIDHEAGELVLRVQGKGRDTKDEFVILTEESYKLIVEYLQKRGTYKPEEALFLAHANRNETGAMTTKSIRRIVRAKLDAVGLRDSKLTAHSLRHTAGTIALMNGADIVSVKEMLRHGNVNTTMIYVHNLERLSKGAEKFINFES